MLNLRYLYESERHYYAFEVYGAMEPAMTTSSHPIRMLHAAPAVVVLCILLSSCASGPELSDGPSPQKEEEENLSTQATEAVGPHPQEKEESLSTRATEALEPQEFNPFFPVGDYSAPIDSRTHLTGDWGGSRTYLADRGVLVHAEGSLTGGFVLEGGRDEENELLGKGDLIVKLDSERMGLWPGGFASIRAEGRTGESVNPDAGTILPVNTTALFPADNEEDEIADLTEFTLTQFLSEQLALFGGLIQTLDGDLIPGASGRGNEHFLNLGFVVNPVTLRTVPYSTLGAGVVYFPIENLYGGLVVMDTEESSGRNKFDSSSGTTVSSEWYLNYQIAERPGGQMLGGLYANRDFTALDQDLRNFIPRVGTVEFKDDSWALYYNAYQMVQTFGKDSVGHRGWGFGTRLGLSDGDPNPIEWYASAILGGRGVVDSRPLDRFGLGYYFLGLTDSKIVDLLPVDDEQGVELFYSFAVTPSIYVTADIQFVDTGLKRQDDAVVGQLRTFIRF